MYACIYIIELLNRFLKLINVDAHDSPLITTLCFSKHSVIFLENVVSKHLAPDKV